MNGCALVGLLVRVLRCGCRAVRLNSTRTVSAESSLLGQARWLARALVDRLPDSCRRFAGYPLVVRR